MSKKVLKLNIYLYIISLYGIKNNMILNKNNREYFQNWYLKLSKDDKRLGTKRTKQDVEFIKKVLKLPKNSRILDLCCGHGRHSILLAKQYSITGLDINKEALGIFKKNIKNKKFKINLIESDMREIPFKEKFDAVLNMYTSFGYFEKDKDNLKVLKSINKSLKLNGKLILDLRNKRPYHKKVLPKYWMKLKNNYILMENDYNDKKNQEEVKLIIIDNKGRILKTNFFVKSYTVSEIKKLLNKAGFSIIKKYGSTENTDIYTKKSERLIILAEKKRRIN